MRSPRESLNRLRGAYGEKWNATHASATTLAANINDHLVPADDPNSEVLAINIIKMDINGGVYADGGKYANEILLFSVNLIEYTGKKVLAVPRCCHHKRGTQDRRRINREVAERDGEIRERSQR